MPLLGWRGNLIVAYRDPLGYLTRLHQTYGDVVAFALGGNGNLVSGIDNCAGTVYVFGPAYNQQILTNTAIFHSVSMIGANYRDDPKGQVLRRLGSGFSSVHGEQHKQRRRMVMPAFHKNHIQVYRDDIVAITQQILDSWSVGEPRDILHEMQRLTLRTATKTLFGLDISEKADNVGRLLQNWLRMSASLPVIMAIDWPGLPYRRFLQLSNCLDQELRAIVEEKRAQNSDANDLLSMMIHARDEDDTRLTEDELIGLVNGFFQAGQETNAAALAWTLFLLAQHPQVMADLVDELEGKLRGDAPTAEQLDDLPLLERVVKESMRVLPPAPFNGRVAVEATELGPYHLPQWSEVMFSHYHTHHMPDLYPQPEKFLPDRWLSINPSPYEYFPFGAGSRMCLGSGMALLEIRIVLAMILQRYRLQLVPRAKIDSQIGIALVPKPGMPMFIWPQDHQFPRQGEEVRGQVHKMVDLTHISV
jgi:cytochrome P450